MDEIKLGAYAIPVILTVVLGLVYRLVSFRDKYKALLAVIVGIGLGLLSIPYKGIPWNIVTVVDACIYGLMVGASAVGLYELQRTVTNPRG